MSIQLSNMKLSIVLHKPQWRNVYTIPMGTSLQKGRHGLYPEIVEAAGNVREKFGCYSWSSDNTVYYCGSFAKDYARGNFKSNLHGRVHNYLQNHKVKDTGHKNTNLMVFENINYALKQGNVILQQLLFESLHFGNDILDFKSFSNDSNLVHVVEQLLISSLRRLGHCEWNRS
jgi:hypothetical protein